MKSLFLGLTASLTLSACASMTGPSPDEIARLPVVSYGQPTPTDSDFILRYPAGVDLPVTARVSGSLLAQTAQSNMTVRVKQDVYVYRDRVSFDGREWSSSASKITGQFLVSPPGMKAGKLDPQSPGEMSAVFDLK